MAKIKVAIEGVTLDVPDGETQTMYGIDFTANVKRNKEKKLLDVSFTAEVEEGIAKSLIDAGKIIKVSK
ncbi:hypothetical protein KAR91_52735 [Candidatus Pacearchaeota archaeon]|nr:hypothetical protein [Candidatus Pacearchaeota archaeon]